MQRQEDEWDSKSLTKFNFLNVAFFLAQSVPLYPLELMKTRLQVLHQPSSVPTRSSFASIISEFREIGHETRSVLVQSGLRGLFRGFWWFVVPSCAAEAIYYTAYNSSKFSILRASEVNASAPTHPAHILAPFVAGFAAEAIITPLNVPIDMVTQRMMIQSATTRLSGSQVIRDILREGGVRDMFRGTTAHVVTYGIASMFWFGTYEIAKRAMRPFLSDQYVGSGSEHDASLTLQDHCLHAGCGVLAGVVGCVTSNPFDVVKTRLQVAGAPETSFILASHQVHMRSHPVPPSSISPSPQPLPTTQIVQPTSLLSGVRNLYLHEGMRGLMRGIIPRIATSAPQSAVALVLYEIAFSSATVAD